MLDRDLSFCKSDGASISVLSKCQSFVNPELTAGSKDSIVVTLEMPGSSAGFLDTQNLHSCPVKLGVDASGAPAMSSATSVCWSVCSKANTLVVAILKAALAGGSASSWGRTCGSAGFSKGENCKITLSCLGGRQD